MSASAAKQVRLHVESNPSEHLLYMDCPTCGKRDKLMIGPAKEGGYWYKCLSAGCATFGTTEAVVNTYPRSKYPAGRNTWPAYRTRRDWYPNGMGPQQRLFTSKYHLDEGQIDRLVDGVVQDADQTYYVFPIYGPRMESRGYMLRRYRGDGPKALVRPYFSTGPLLNWFFSEENYGTIAVVEDPVSACRLSEYCTTVALGGTSISQEGVEEILSLLPKRIYVILDNDAVNKGLELARLFCGKGISLPLFGPDIKDMSPEEFENLGAIISGR